MNRSRGRTVKTRNLRVEKTRRFRLDCGIAAFMTVGVFGVYTKLGRPGCLQLQVSALLVLLFTTWLETYDHFTAQMAEIRLCILLANLYALGVGAVFSVICGRSELLLPHMILFAVQTTVMLLGGGLMYRYFHDSRIYRNPSLLVVAAKGNDARLRRLKYGVLSDFDAWYTEIEQESRVGDNEWEQLKTQMDGFDALCIFDNIRGEAYDTLVCHAMKRGMEIYTVPLIMGVNINYASLTHFDDIPVLHLDPYELSLWDRFWKRLLDIVVALSALVVALLPMAVIAVCIKLDSPGPVLYRQDRYTKDHRVFQILKFRTMVQNAEKQTGPVFAQKNDPRITRVGKVLRKFRLDELPQIFNILEGSMSLVGPRPERPFFADQFEKEIPQYGYRFTVKAGLTALSHVFGRYSTYICDRTYYDLRYIAEYSFLQDIRILILSTKTMFLPNAAEGEDEFKIKSRIQTGSR